MKFNIFIATALIASVCNFMRAADDNVPTCKISRQQLQEAAHMLQQTAQQMQPQAEAENKVHQARLQDDPAKTKVDAAFALMEAVLPQPLCRIINKYAAEYALVHKFSNNITGAGLVQKDGKDFVIITRKVMIEPGKCEEVFEVIDLATGQAVNTWSSEIAQASDPQRPTIVGTDNGCFAATSGWNLRIWDIAGNLLESIPGHRNHYFTKIQAAGNVMVSIRRSSSRLRLSVNKITRINKEDPVRFFQVPGHDFGLVRQGDTCLFADMGGLWNVEQPDQPVKRMFLSGEHLTPTQGDQGQIHIVGLNHVKNVLELYDDSGNVQKEMPFEREMHCMTACGKNAVVAGCKDGTVRIVDVVVGREVAALPQLKTIDFPVAKDHPHLIISQLAANADGSLIVASNEMGFDGRQFNSRCVGVIKLLNAHERALHEARQQEPKKQ